MENNFLPPEEISLISKSNIYLPLEGTANIENTYQKNKQKQDNIFLIKKELKDTEWTNLPDSPLSQTKQEEWAVYRNELKTLLKTINDTIVWPAKPA